MEHPLRLYRRRTETSLDALARETGASKATLSRIETGKQLPSYDLIRRIIAATGGELTANDFFGEAAAEPQPEQAA